MGPSDITTLCELLCCIRADIVKLGLLVFIKYRDTSSCFIDYRVILSSSNYSILGGASNCTINPGLTYYMV